MFGLRTKRTHRDRQSGLVFRWRLPVGSHLGFVAAVGVVALLSAGLATAVRVRVGGPPREPERRGALVLVPQGPEWRALEMLALEAGPMPRREHPATEAAIAGLLAGQVADATPPGHTYQPRLSPVPVNLPSVASMSDRRPSPGVLPALPTPPQPSENPPPPETSQPLVLAANGIRAIVPQDPPPPALARGNRYLLAYDESGRVTRVTTLFAETPTSDDRAELWLRQLRIENGTRAGGWTAVEISSRP